MSRSGRRPWETPIEYEPGDRFPSEEQAVGDIRPDPDLIPNPPIARRPPTAKRTPPPPSPSGPRPSWRDNGGGVSNDDAPLNYNRGPHTGELDVDDRDELD